MQGYFNLETGIILYSFYYLSFNIAGRVSPRDDNDVPPVPHPQSPGEVCFEKVKTSEIREKRGEITQERED